jgi:hypothetical protein
MVRAFSMLTVVCCALYKYRLTSILLLPSSKIASHGFHKNFGKVANIM